MIDVDSLVENKTQCTYPNILVSEAMTLPLVVSNLTEGSIQVILEYKGKKKVIKRISPSAYNIKLLLDCVGPFTYTKSKDDSVRVKTVNEYLELV